MDRRAARRATGTGAVALGMALALTDGACDNDSAAEAFVGTWQVFGGTVNATCGGTGHLSNVQGAQLKLSQGSDSPLLIDARGCLLKLDISGQTAVARPGQTCQTTMEVNNSNLAIDLAVSLANFVVNNNQAELTIDGTAMTVFLGDCGYHTRLSASKNQNP